MSGRDSGGDINDMAVSGTTVPEDSAAPRYIKSVPRPGEAADDADPNQLGGSTLADAAGNARDIPRTNQDTSGDTVLTGTGDTLPAQVDSKRLHDVPGGVTHDPNAKGSDRYTKHIAGQSDFETGASDGPGFETAPGDEGLNEDDAAAKYERKET